MIPPILQKNNKITFGSETSLTFTTAINRAKENVVFTRDNSQAWVTIEAGIMNILHMIKILAGGLSFVNSRPLWYLVILK